MTQKALAAKMLSMRKKAEAIEQIIDIMSKNLYAEKLKLQRLVENYSEKRSQFIDEALSDGGDVRGIPPKIELQCQWMESNVNLIIHEEVAIKKAS